MMVLVMRGAGSRPLTHLTLRPPSTLMHGAHQAPSHTAPQLMFALMNDAHHHIWCQGTITAAILLVRRDVKSPFKACRWAGIGDRRKTVNKLVREGTIRLLLNDTNDYM